MDNRNNKGSLDGMIDALKTNSDVLKGAVAILLGSYLISIKYYIVMDFLLFASGTMLVLYGLACLKFARIQELMANMVARFRNFMQR
jgi:hypothetical protein